MARHIHGSVLSDRGIAATVVDCDAWSRLWRCTLTPSNGFSTHFAGWCGTGGVDAWLGGTAGIGNAHCRRHNYIHAGEIDPSLSPEIPPRTGARRRRSGSDECGTQAVLAKVSHPLSFTRCQTLLVIVPKQFVQQVNCFVRYISLVLRCYKSSPWFSRVSVSGQYWNRHIESSGQPNLPSSSSYWGSNRMLYLSMYAYNSSVPSTLVILTS